LKNCLVEKKIGQVKESIRISKFNIENQEKKLEELNKKIAIVQVKLSALSSLPSSEFENFTNIDTKLKIYANLQKGLILELQGELTSNENRLQELKSNHLHTEL